MAQIKRILRMDLPSDQSAFLWGARKTGKTTFLGNAFSGSIVFDFLKSDLHFDFLKRPALLRERLSAMPGEALRQPIILDEVQKVPAVLDEVHWLIENRGLNFILCGSSARKLKRGQANLLGGRAWRYEMFPLVSAEIESPDLLTILNRGLIPDHFQQTGYRKSLTAYVQDYLKEEVFAEGLTRNIPAFSRFFDAIGWSHGELVNYANIARECGVDAKTVREYYQIIVDTLLGTLVPPFKKRQNRQVISRTHKFYLFDVGVAGAIMRRSIAETRGEQFGRAFEHFIFMELSAHRSYSELGYPIHFWRTKTGLEVDFVLGDGEVAVEVKGTDRVDNRALRPMKAFCEEHSVRLPVIVCNEPAERLAGSVHIMPWRVFLDRLWSGNIIT